jgi:hypothetical protein
MPIAINIAMGIFHTTNRYPDVLDEEITLRKQVIKTIIQYGIVERSAANYKPEYAGRTTRTTSRSLNTYSMG